MDIKDQSIGIIGLGQMGTGIALNLTKAGYSIAGYDLKPEAVERLVRSGGLGAKDSKEIVATRNVVLICVEGRDAIQLADEILLPNARPGQFFIDHSTMPVPETRRIGYALVDRGCKYLDAPISGGKGGAESGTLRIFVGGDREVADDCWPMFKVIGNPEKIVYCGPLGMGQTTKVVQQLTSRFPDVARLEVMAFGLRSGLELETVMRALDVPLDSKDPYARLGRGIRDGNIADFSFEFAEWGYYLEQAQAAGFRMPLLEAMYSFCKEGERTTSDALNRPEPSVWNELMKSGRKD